MTFFFAGLERARRAGYSARMLLSSGQPALFTIGQHQNDTVGHDNGRQQGLPLTNAPQWPVDRGDVDRGLTSAGCFARNKRPPNTGSYGDTGRFPLRA